MGAMIPSGFGTSKKQGEGSLLIPHKNMLQVACI